MRYSGILLCFVFSLFILPSSSVFAQDTFGPICDGVTVTCPPTPSPTTAPTSPPQDQPSATPTTPPQPPPVSGSAEMTMLVAGVSGACLLAGLMLRKSLV